MTLSSLSEGELTRSLRGEGLALRTGPFAFRIRTSIPAVAKGLQTLYADYPLLGPEAFIDFDVHLARGIGLRRWLRPQVRFRYDGGSPFEPLPRGHALPLLEWAMNWCVSTQAHQYLILHAAVVERNGFAAILPAPPGSGKSTLCAGLIWRGWRLLSDELALIVPGTLDLQPLCRPVSLKNASLDVVRAYAPQAVFSEPTLDTSKGTVAHMRVQHSHLERIGEVARPGWIVFPRYVAGSSARLVPRARGDSMLELGRNAFNYSILGVRGFAVLADVVGQSDCYDFEYSRLDDAVAVFDALADRRRS